MRLWLVGGLLLLGNGAKLPTSHFFNGNFNHQLTKHIHHCLRFGWAEKARKAFSEVRMLKGLWAEVGEKV